MDKWKDPFEGLVDGIKAAVESIVPLLEEQRLRQEEREQAIDMIRHIAAAQDLEVVIRGYEDDCEELPATMEAAGRAIGRYYRQLIKAGMPEKRAWSLTMIVAPDGKSGNDE